MSAEFDIIFAGGGTAACVIAGRLIAANHDLRILVVERGQHSHNVSSHAQPCRYVEHLSPTSKTMSFHPGKPSVHLNGRTPFLSCGQSVGGGSTVNFMVYVRGAASDYDGWAKLGNKGWSFEEVLPLIRKVESFVPVPDQATHGYSGPVGVSVGGGDLGIGNQFLDVGKAYDPSRSQVLDNNDFYSANAYSPAYKYIDSATGKRSDSASTYLYPHSGNPNLKIVVGKRVKRVIIENGRAVGIEYTTDVKSSEGISSELVTVKATKLVVVSAGTFGSPPILERSGIGATSILREKDIPEVVDLPGVGENYQDHSGFGPVFYASGTTKTMNDLWKDPAAIAAYQNEWEQSGTGKIAHNGVEALLKLRPTASQLESLGPVGQSRWKEFFENYPDKPMGIIGAISGCPSVRLLSPDKNYFSFMCYILYGESTGRVHITSGEDANASLDVDPGYCSKAGDVAQLVLMYKIGRELARRMPTYRGEPPSEHPKFQQGSPAECREADGPVPIDASDIVYSSEDDEAIKEYLRRKVLSTWHSLGTCAMKPRDQGGVVDARLNVYGVEGLKVADLSICPTNVGNNTYSTALLIGEKAAVIIAEDLVLESP